MYAVLLSLGFMGAGLSIALPAQGSLLGHLIPSHQQRKAFALRYLSLNAGMGFGGLFATAAISVDSPHTFSMAYIADGVTFLLAAGLVGAPHIRDTFPTPATRVRLRATFPRSGALWGLCTLAMLFTIVGFGQFKVATYGITEAGTATLGLAYLANTISVVAAQLPAVRFTSSWPKHYILATVGVLWAAAWLTVWLASITWTGLIIAAASIIAVGECMMATSLVPLVNEIAPAEYRGRYNASLVMSQTIGNLLGPAVAGVLLSHSQRSTTPLALGILAIVTVPSSLLLPQLLSRRTQD
jgi:MFS family permease